MRKPLSPLVIILGLTLGCSSDDSDVSDIVQGSTPLDLTESLNSGEVRAGVVRNSSALFGGVAAEGQLGDFKIYNDRVQFIIQGVRRGHYMVQQGGGVVDADFVRSEGQPGRDLVDDWLFMSETGHLIQPHSVYVLDDGVESGTAIIRTIGTEDGMNYIEGALETELFDLDGLEITTDYTLDADAWLMEVTTTVTPQFETTVQMGDAILGGKEAGRSWVQGVGLDQDPPEDLHWMGFMGIRNEIAVGVFPTTAQKMVPDPTNAVFNSLLAFVSSFEDETTITPDQPGVLSRYYGVGPDLATLSDAWLTRIQQTDSSIEVENADIAVAASDGPVEGARVTFLVDGAPWTLAITDQDGQANALVPTGSDITFAADGRGPGLFLDLPTGSGNYAPYAGEEANALALQTMEEGATAVPQAHGRGMTEGDEGPLELGVPGWAVINTADNLPFEARFTKTDDDAVDDALAQSRPEGYTALGWSIDGTVKVTLEPGQYDVIVYRGSRYEIAEFSLVIEANEINSTKVELEEAYGLEDWLVADPHVHAAPSPDGGVPMADRLIVMAATGVQLHFGTDHDHIVDYSPLLQPLGLEDVLATIAASEFSPLLRGHINSYPLTAQPEQTNGGAWLWWDEEIPNTEWITENLRSEYPSAILQVNHPLSGLASFAGWEPGKITRGDYWSSDFDAIEVLNGGSYSEAMELFLDLTSRGLLVAPIGVSDSHGYLSGGPGRNVTFLYTQTNDPTSLSMEALIDSMLDRSTVVSNGPFIETNIVPGSTILEATVLEVEVLSPSWIETDTITLYKNGEPFETVGGKKASFVLNSDEDAYFLVVVEGNTSMSPMSSSTPWAMTSPILFDTTGDGWDSPLPPLTVSEN